MALSAPAGLSSHSGLLAACLLRPLLLAVHLHHGSLPCLGDAAVFCLQGVPLGHTRSECPEVLSRAGVDGDGGAGVECGQRSWVRSAAASCPPGEGRKGPDAVQLMWHPWCHVWGLSHQGCGRMSPGPLSTSGSCVCGDLKAGGAAAPFWVPHDYGHGRVCWSSGREEGQPS